MDRNGRRSSHQANGEPFRRRDGIARQGWDSGGRAAGSWREIWAIAARTWLRRFQFGG